MSVADFVPSDSRKERSRHRVTEYVADRLETGAETVTDLSARVRHAAGERAAGVVGRGADELRVRAGDQGSALRDRLVERTVDELSGLASGRTVEDRRIRPDAADVDDPLDRALESFLRRYGLERDRLDERTLATIRDRLANRADTEFEELLGRPGTGNGGRRSSGSTSGFDSIPSRGASANAADRDPTDHGFGEAYARLCADLDVETDQPPGDVLEAVLQRDAVAVGHAVERVLSDDSLRLPVERPVDASGDGNTSGKAGSRSSGANGIDVDEGAARSAATVALAAMALLSEGAGADRSLARAIPTLASALVDSEGGDAAPGDVPIEALSELAPRIEDTLGPAALRSKSSGSLALVALFVANLVAMGLGAWVSHRRAPPIPDEIRGPDGETVVTRDQVRLGKKAFQANGLMNHGSILGNGSYFGVDLTADALEAKAEFMREYYAIQRDADSFDALEDDERAIVTERVERELDAEAPEGSIVRYSAAEAYAHRRLRDRYVDRYHGGAPERGIPEGFVDSAAQAERIADFACWTAWMAHTNRPGSDHSYTNDWPYVPETGNRPTGGVVVWSTISVVLLVAGGGAGVWAYNAMDFAEPTTELVDVPSPDSVSVTPAQHAAAWYVPVAGALFVAQTLLGALLAHYYVERTGFYGLGDALDIDVVSLLPFSVARAWHVNLGILWITALWLGGGLFLPGLFGDSDPPWQAEATTALLGVLVIATLGAFAGVWLGTHGRLGSPADGDRWWWFGTEGLEYLEVGRFWKLGLLGGFVGWSGLVLRGVRRMEEPATGLGHFLVYAGGSIALMFAASMLYTPDTNMAMTEFWRWWVVHMWVEGVFEFFVTAVVSTALVSMDLVEKADAEAAILFEVFVIMAAGIVGVSHHYWWVGLPDIWVPLGTTFSTLEFVPLVFVLYRSLGEYRSLQAQGEAFPYTLPLLFIIGSSVWNFVGGGVLGFFINLPLINYFEHGTYLTVAHGHTATFGAFGLLALGLGTYVLRVVTPEEEWNPAWFRGSFWLTNAGLVVMTVASLLPIGFLQLRTAYRDGYAAARSLEFYEQDHVQALLWARTLGDTPMILGALAFTAGAVRHLRASLRSDR